MDTKPLEEIGLTKSEARVYLVVLELGKTKVGPIIKKSGSVSSVVHTTMNNLLEKGLISYVKRGKIKFYTAVSPEQLVRFVNEKKRRVLELIPQLKQIEEKSREREDAEIFQGTSGIRAMLDLLIEGAPKGEDYLFFSILHPKYQEEIEDFFDVYVSKLRSKGLVVKGLVPENLKELFSRRKNLKIKYPSFPVPYSISICLDKVAITSWGEKPVGYLINSKKVACDYRSYFNQVWKES